MTINSQQGFHAANWTEACFELNRSGTSYVLVTLLGSAGSTPRAAGTKMVVTSEDIFDTIGGGNLEFSVIQKARALLVNNQSEQKIEHFPLGASLGQCCGGSTTVLMEAIVSQHMALDVYGAGHVAQALMQILSALPVSVRWIDSRAELFPEHIPANIKAVINEFPEDEVKNAVANTATLVLTHNHQLDFSIAENVLRRDDFSWLGVIGSDTKAIRFQKRLLNKGVDEALVARMQSPVGLADVPGKLPMEVAVSIAGEIIGLYHKESHKLDHRNETLQSSKANRKGVHWSEMKQIINETVVSK